MSAKALFGWPIYSDVGVTYAPTLSSGNWSASLPLANLQDRRLSKVARSTNALAASTQFDVDLGVARAIRVIAIPKHSISSTGTVRVRGSNTAGVFTSPVYDSTALAAWPVGVTAEDTEGMNLAFILALGAAQTARYWRVEVVDTANPAGYIDIARIIIAGGWEPTVYFSIGAKLGLETETTRELTDGGAAVYNEKAKRRTASFSIELIPETEAIQQGFAMQFIAGTSRQIMFVWNANDTTLMRYKSFLAVLRELSPIEYPAWDRNSLAFSLTEEL